ncbi:MAG: TonB-dependent receptor [Acidobacteriia bacterium]|nr:TonB-dependent receptor [Terriglobia bacterium]
MAKKLCAAIALGAMLLCLATLSFAQATSESAVKGNLAGTVTDPSNAVIQGAQVTISGPIGEKTATTDAEGRFLFQVLIPGSYSVKIVKDGFKTSDIKSAQVLTGHTSNISVKLELGTSSTVVEVTAAAVGVDTTSTATSSNLTDNFYQAVPVGRGVTGLFYAAPGVASGGGTGTANPSISGGTGLENNYIADGVSITDGAFGGIGVYSRNYGSLSTGINLSFVKEVQVKSGGFEAQYGKSTGGIVQIVTKTGSNQFHGSVGGFFAPQSMEATRLQTDDFGAGGANERFNLQGKILHQSNYDVDTQVGGYVPGMKDHLFFFGAFNPQWNTDHDQFAQYRNPSDLGTAGLAGPTQTFLGNFDVPVRVYSYSGKVTYRLNDNHQFEASIFGDPTYGDQNANGVLGPQTASKTTFDKLQYGTRNFVVRYNGTLSPTWLFNASWSWGHNNLNDTPFSPGVSQILDYTQRTPCDLPGTPNGDCTAPTNKLRGQFTRQGLGYYENTTGENYGLNFDTQKAFNFLGQHTLGFGYRYDINHYDGTKLRTGSTIPVDQGVIDALLDPNTPGNGPIRAALAANGTNAAFQLRARGGDSCIESGSPNAAELYVTGLGAPGGPDACADGGIGVNLRQVRGEFGNLNFKTNSHYNTLFAQDSWSLNKYVTVSAGLRWEQQRLAGVNAHYTFTDNWSPRLGVSIDPWGNRKSKVYANFGRYTEALPLDMGIRSLSSEFDFADTNWVPPTDGAGHVVVDSDGVMDLSTLVGTQTPQANGGFIRSYNGGVAAQSSVAFAPQARSEYLDEFVAGFEHEFGNSGVIFTARYTDRRIKRIIEDLAALSPDAADAGLAQQYLIGNPSNTTDYFTNPIQNGYNAALGGSCPVTTPYDTLSFNGGITDSFGNSVTNTAGNDNMCVTPGPYSNGAFPGDPVADGVADGFVDPIRKYQAMEFEVNKSMSKGWLLRANYRIAKLLGNYEGSFRNDNGQVDPNISSLFDFTRGDWNLLGQQFTPGVLNTDVRHLVNGYVSYTFANHLKGLTVGSSVHFQTGIPINNLYAHPVYANAGEIPFCADETTNCTSARGALGRTKDYGQVDYHMDYPIRVTEGTRIRLGADLFNLANSKTLLRVDQNKQRTVGVLNSDFSKPTGVGPSAASGNANPGYLRPFYARFSVKFEF